MARRSKAVYFFGDKIAEGRAHQKDLLGGKGANLAEMIRIGLPVPAGFTISTEVCAAYTRNNQRYPSGLQGEVTASLHRVEKSMGAVFGDRRRPLLVSVRSGARVSMPGMMDTVLNLGLNEITLQGLIEQTRNPRFAYDSYRRFVQMYGDVVMGLKPESHDDLDPFEEILARKKKQRRVQFDHELSAADLRELVTLFKSAIRERTGETFPEDPHEQLWGAIGAVFRSWMNDRAIAYRKLNGISDDWGTAVNVQAMVFGNMGDDSGTGVAFTRNPATGEKEFYGEFLINAQGEDVVAGIRTPLPIRQLEMVMPKIYKQLLGIQKTLERHYHEMQDIEFTIQNNRLWMLQTRTGKRTGKAAVRIAVNMVEEGLISKEEAIRRVTPDQIEQYLSPVFDPAAKKKAVEEKRVLAKGLPAGPGAATGRVVFNALDAEAWAKRGDPVILTRIETSPEDIRGMAAAQGILTARGGMTSHAALVARQMGKVCVAGCGELQINYKTRRMVVEKRAIKEGDWLSIDGTTGEVILGRIETRPSEVVQAVLKGRGGKARSSDVEFHVFEKIMHWADQHRRLNVRTNADQPDQASQAVAFGAEGIGLCRTEHMFFGEGKIGPMREMILAERSEDRRTALVKLLPLQRRDFAGIFRAMNGRPVTIRTLDPPLHEFLPHTDREIRELAQSMNVKPAIIAARVESLKEQTPMMGHRGCRLGITYPEITEMQARAIFEAACDVRAQRIKVFPEIMIPLVGHTNELRAQEQVVRRVAEEVFRERKTRIPYLVGTMIELPRAALCANRIAEHAEFFSYGTNDLTQTTFGISRDDSGKFLPFYLDREILPSEPFTTLDFDGVGELVRIGIERGRSTKPELKIGICGEHGGDPATIAFCHRLGMEYVSCSPYRVPVARLAAARAALLNGSPPKAKKSKSPARKRARTA
jgi:pyruvate,orthophosphate dikinase